MRVKDIIFSFTGLIGSVITTSLGGWTAGMTTLIIFMAIDYLSGLLVAGVFKASPKSETGALESRVGFKGLCRKGMALLVVLVAHRLDLMTGSNYIRDAVIIGFSVNELLSIIENAGLMGLPLPKQIVNAVDILKSKVE
jgi:toxin secretion/phage lysis holin